MTDYRPIACDLHSVLELLAMRRTRAVAHVGRPDGGARAVEGTIVDVSTRAGAEFLDLVDPEGRTQALRLDRLQAITSTDGHPLWPDPAGPVD